MNLFKDIQVSPGQGSTWIYLDELVELHGSSWIDVALVNHDVSDIRQVPLPVYTQRRVEPENPVNGGSSWKGKNSDGT